MSLCVVYDDRADVSDEIRELIGIARYGQTLYRKRSLLDRCQELMRDAGVDEFIHLVRDSDLESLRAHAQRAAPGTRYLYYPSQVVPTDVSAALHFLKKLQYARRDLAVRVRTDPPGAPVLLLGEPALLGRLDAIARRQWGTLQGPKARAGRDAGERPPADVPNQAGLRDISDPADFLAFLSTNFDARHFNRVEHDGLSVVKRSSDREKIRREYTFLRLVDGPMQPFFLRPYDLREFGDGGSYRLERLRVPDMAVQWVHDALSAADFRVFLGRMRAYFELRPTRPCGTDEREAVFRELFSDKLRRRIGQLRAMPIMETLEPLIARCTPYASLEAQADRFDRLARRHARAFAGPSLAFTHGDPCFSNILYDKRSAAMKLIDPRGCDHEAGMYSHPWYDPAKLAHSALGGYDFMNLGLVAPTFGADLRLAVEAPPRDLAAHRALFTQMMESIGFPLVPLRLLEASLFLSMLPLHADVPGKVLAFFLTGAGILDEVEAAS